MSGQLAGKVALLTRASSGIGRATALLFAQEGAIVVVADTDTRGGNETVAMIKKNEGEALFVRANGYTIGRRKYGFKDG